MNNSRLLLSSFRAYSLSKMLPINTELKRSYNVMEFRQKLADVKLNQKDFNDAFTPIFGLSNSKSSLLISTSIFFSIFVLINLIILAYYCYRAKKMTEDGNDYSIRTLHAD